MSNFKKFLSLVLATVMVAGMMVFTAPSAAAYAPTGDYADNIALLNAFDVMLGDGVSFGEKENVTRWQMALFIARIVTGETGNDMWEADKSEFFTDVKADHYPGAIDFCAEMGYIKGVGDNKFDPEGNIIYQDALTMLVRLLGYETESTSYPWGYILTARKIMVGTDTLTSEINTNNKTPLLREEVANLLAKAIYVPVLDAKGNPTVTLVESGLDAVNLGDGTLVATWNGAIADYTVGTTDDKGTDDTSDDVFTTTYPKYGEVVFKVGSEFVTVKAKNVTKTDELDMNELLGFKASLVDVKGTKLANMNTVTIYDTFKVSANTHIEVSGAKITNILQYGDANNNLFVASKANLSTKGRVIVCDVKNDGITKDDIARFIPFETVKAVYAANNISVAKSNSWPADMKLTLYYVATNDRYEAALYNATKKNADAALLVSIIAEDKDLGGLNLGTGVSNSKGDATARTALAGYTYKESTSLFVHVNGEFKSGDIVLGNVKTVGGHTFVTVAETVEIATGTANLNGIEDGKNVKLGDTSFPVGYGKAIAAVNGWYGAFADLAAEMYDEKTSVLEALMGKKVNYTTANGAVIDIAEFSEEEEDETFNSPYNKDSLVLLVKQDGNNITVNADNTITFNTFNTATLAYENVKVDQINGVRLGQLINQLGVEMTANILNKTATKTVELVKALLADNAYNIDGKSYFITLVAVANKADDVYSISTKAADLAAIKRAVLGSAAGQDKADDNATVNLTFTKYNENALSNSKFNLGKFDTAENAWDFTGTYLSVNKNTKYVTIGVDAVKIFSDIVPATGNSLTFAESDGTIALAMGNDLVVVYSATAISTDIVKFTTGSSNVPVASNKGDWYTLTWKSDYIDMSVETIDKVPYFTYNFKDLYNLTTGKNEAVSIVSTNYFANPATDIFGAKWLSGNSNSTAIDSSNIVATAYKYINASDEEVEDKKGTLYDDKWGTNNANSNFYSVWFITEDGAISESSIYSWGLANGYEVGVITGITQPKKDGSVVADQHKLVISNKKLTATTTGYTVSAGDATKDTDIVVTYSMKVSNVSNGANGDELMKNVAYDNTTGYQNKAKSELVLYKLSENGEAIVIANFADAFNKDSTEIADSQAK